MGHDDVFLYASRNSRIYMLNEILDGTLVGFSGAIRESHFYQLYQETHRGCQASVRDGPCVPADLALAFKIFKGAGGNRAVETGRQSLQKLKILKKYCAC